MFLDLLIPLLTGLAAIAIGGAVVMARNSRRAPLEARLRQLDVGAQPDPQAPPVHSMATSSAPLVGVLDKVGQAVSSKKTSATLREQLAHAGFHSRTAPAIFLGAKMLMFLTTLPVLGALVLSLNMPVAVNPAATKLLIVFSGAVLMFFVPNLYVAHCREQRRAEIRSHLPDAIDLLEISVSAGMGLDQAWNSVGGEVRNVSPMLADEMALANLEIHLGAPRAVAMRHMADRTGSEDLASLVAILVQSDRFGTSVSEALRTFANSMRETRSMRAQEYAEKMAVKLIFPMVVFIFVPVLIVMAGPAVITLFKILGKQ